MLRENGGYAMDKLKMEEKELKEKIEFCSLLIKYGNLVGASSDCNSLCADEMYIS